MNILKKLYKHNHEQIAIKYLNNSQGFTEITYGSLFKNIEKATEFLIENKVAYGDKIMLFGSKSIEYLTAFFAIVGIGAIAVPVFSSTGKASFLDKIDNCAPSLIFCDENLIGTMHFYTKNYDNLKIISFLNYDYSLQVNNDFIFQYPQLDESSVMTIHYTSGTTSSSAKGVVHSHKNYLRAIDTLEIVFGADAKDVFWCTADFAWITGTVYGIVAPLCKGITIVINKNTSFTLEAFKNTLEITETTIVYTAPTLLRYFIKGNNITNFKPNKLKRIFSVGEALKSDVISWVSDNFGVDIYDTWFQSETGSIIIANSYSDTIKIGSMGKALNDVCVDILDSNGDIALPNKIGSICIKKNWSSMFLDYFNRNDLYLTKFNSEWYFTGDLGSKDENGYFWYFSREDDIINTAGHLVSPLEIEKAINEINEIKECVVFSEQDDLLGDRIVCLLSVFENVDYIKLEREVKLKVRSDVSTYAVPQVFYYMDVIPKTNSGKLIRRR